MPTKKNLKESFAIIGAGKVGSAIGCLLKNAGYPIVSIADLSGRNARRGMKYTGAKIYKDVVEAAAQAPNILIATPDDAILSVCAEISEGGAVKKGNRVVHLSGAGGLDLLEPARRLGAHVAGIHPLQTFADVESAIRNIRGSAFGVTADDEIRNWAFQIVDDIGGIPFSISEAEKPLYHAAACMASNYLITLIHIVENIYLSLGLDQEAALRAFWPLVEGTMQNIKTGGCVNSLTGPISRGDAGTIRKHLDVLKTKAPHVMDFYRTMGILTVDIVEKKGTLSEDKAGLLKSILSGGIRNE
jgi:predicted short-subunit dehydrogenase-like oxidoreductase (DUF2520 family)